MRNNCTENEIINHVVIASHCLAEHRKHHYRLKNLINRVQFHTQFPEESLTIPESQPSSRFANRTKEDTEAGKVSEILKDTSNPGIHPRRSPPPPPSCRQLDPPGRGSGPPGRHWRPLSPLQAVISISLRAPSEPPDWAAHAGVSG